MKHLEISDLPEESRELVRECEVQGSRTLFERNGAPVAVLVSHDEYLAMRETIAVFNDSLLFARIEGADEEGRKGKLILAEDLGLNRLERLRIAESVESDWRGLSEDSRAVTRTALEKLDDSPIAGAPLYEPLEGIWVYRAGDLRVLYRIAAEGRFVVILALSKQGR